MSEELKLCPFCNGAAKSNTSKMNGVTETKIGCETVSCFGNVYDSMVVIEKGDSSIEAIAAWNWRIA